jgi:hypothetical protein
MRCNIASTADSVEAFLNDVGEAQIPEVCFRISHISQDEVVQLISDLSGRGVRTPRRVVYTINSLSRNL